MSSSLCVLNPLNTELNPICHLLALLGAHHILHVSRVRVKRKLELRKGWTLFYSGFPYKLTLLSTYIMKVYGGMEIQIHSFVTLALDGRKWSALHPDHFTPEKNPPSR
jgi:hypothetical protein